MMKYITHCFICVLISYIFGCIPVSREPLSPALDAKHDKRLTGTWVGHAAGEDDVFWVHFVEAENSMTDIVLVASERKGADVMFFKMFPTMTGGSCFMNIKTDEKDRPDSTKVMGGNDYIIARYDISGDVLKIWLINDKIKGAIERGELKGTVEKQTWSDNITMTDTAQNIVNYLQKDEHRDCFSLLYLCRKVNVPAFPKDN